MISTVVAVRPTQAKAGPQVADLAWAFRCGARGWSTALYTSVMEQGIGDHLLPYLAREVHGEWRLGLLRPPG